MTAQHRAWPRFYNLLKHGESKTRRLIEIVSWAGLGELLWTLRQQVGKKEHIMVEDDPRERDWAEVINAVYWKIKTRLFPPSTQRRDYFDRLIQPVKTLANFEELSISLDNFSKYIKNHGEVVGCLQKTTHDKILISYRGGIGDTLYLFWAANAIRRLFPGSSLFLANNIMNANFLRDLTKDFQNVVVIETYNRNWKNFMELIANANIFDLVFDCRYIVKIISPSGKYEDYASRVNNKFMEYNKYFKEFPDKNYYLKYYDKNIFDMFSITTGINLEEHDVTFYLKNNDFAISNIIMV